MLQKFVKGFIFTFQYFYLTSCNDSHIPQERATDANNVCMDLEKYSTII